MPTKIITPTIRLLALVGLLSGMASEMLYPIMPVYLRSVGFSVVLIGLLEGVAEATAGLSKGYFGHWSDQSGRRLPFVRLGYLFSALSKPMLALLPLPGWVFATRTLDRLGKGLRTAPRDALLASQSMPQTRGRVFGFHRSMDTLGAVLGPLVALVYLAYFPGQYVTLFLLAFGPGLLSILLTFRLTEPALQPALSQTSTPEPTASVPTASVPTASVPTVSPFALARYWRTSPPEYRRVVGGLLVFALFNSSDVFLLLKIKEAGLSDTAVVGLYVFYNLVHALMAYPVGRLADRLGLRATLLVGLGLFVLVYEGMAIANHVALFIGLMALYGLYAATTEGIAKAWISTVSGSQDTATAIGTYAGLSSVGALVANALAGWLWSAFGPAATFGVTAAATLLVIVYLVAIEGRHAVVSTLSKSQAILNLYRNPMEFDAKPPARQSNQRSVVTMTRSAFIAILVLLTSLGGWTVYVSFLLVSATTPAERPTTALVRPTGAALSRTTQPSIRQRDAEHRPTDPLRSEPATDSLARRNVADPTAGLANPAPVSADSSATRSADATPLPGPDPTPQPPVIERDTTPAADSSVESAPDGSTDNVGANRYTLASTYAYFHNEPDESTRRAAFINIWNNAKLTPLADRNGFIYVVYTNEQGQTSKGWLPKRNLKPLIR